LGLRSKASTFRFTAASDGYFFVLRVNWRCFRALQLACSWRKIQSFKSEARKRQSLPTWVP
jgi:hypothetical protein